MSGLKYLTKAILCCFLLCAANHAKAQILGIGINFEQLNLPQEFYKSLKNCHAYSFQNPIKSDDIEVNTTYTIEPTAEKQCKLHIEGTTNTGVHITQDCSFTLAQATEYSNALHSYQSKGYSPRWDNRQIENDADYLAAYAIMSNRKICRFKRDKIDNTAEIRQNFPTCSAAKQTENTAAITATRKIVGKTEDLCHYQFVLQNNKTTPAETESSRQITFDCRLNAVQIRKYLQILEATVVPSEEGYDFSAIQRISPAEEMNFILDNCEFTTQ